MYQVLRREAEGEWSDISEETLLRELRQKAWANPYAIVARLQAGDSLVAQSTRYRWTGEIVLRNLTKRTIANSAHAAYGA